MTDYAEPLTHIGNGVDHLTKALANRQWDEAEAIAERMHAEMVKVRALINWRKHGNQEQPR